MHRIVGTNILTCYDCHGRFPPGVCWRNWDGRYACPKCNPTRNSFVDCWIKESLCKTVKCEYCDEDIPSIPQENFRHYRATAGDLHDRWTCKPCWEELSETINKNRRTLAERVFDNIIKKYDLQWWDEEE